MYVSVLNDALSTLSHLRLFLPYKPDEWEATSTVSPMKQSCREEIKRKCEPTLKASFSTDIAPSTPVPSTV